MLQRFIRPSATPEALRYGVKKGRCDHRRETGDVQTVRSSRVRESDRQGSTDDLPDHKGDTLGNLGSGSVHLENPVYYATIAEEGFCLEGAGR